MYFYQLDQLGTPLSLTDSNNNIVWQAHYSVFGKATITVNDIDNPIRFQGQYYDSESGLHYNHFRYYDPQTGRFISQDPIGLLGGINHYQYAPNHINWIDPLGLMAKPEDCPKFAGKAVIHKYQPTAGNPFGHYSVEIISSTKTSHTHQVITEGTTTIVDVAECKPSVPVVAVAEVDLPDAHAAQLYQSAVEYIDMGPYDRKSNSCVTHVSNVLRAGGVDIPQSALGEYKFMKNLGI
ncbi:RHS repeat-associated core domain-containing protein [Rheinheimera nanhaiensis]|uniref:RHS repeat-associated core domain-containing protein n=1 Tax=Rheinheimera nanhaiensis TaxID=1163621 RepID=UPI002351F715|nr:RHS repeat-associated core domain-containing protein [Rheinheimera nanhaiensis]